MLPVPGSGSGRAQEEEADLHVPRGRRGVGFADALLLQRGVVNPLGLYDLGRRPRPVATAYKEMVDRFAAEPLLPYGSVLGFTTDVPQAESEECY